VTAARQLRENVSRKKAKKKSTAALASLCTLVMKAHVLPYLKTAVHIWCQSKISLSKKIKRYRKIWSKWALTGSLKKGTCLDVENNEQWRKDAARRILSMTTTSAIAAHVFWTAQVRWRKLWFTFTQRHRVGKTPLSL